MITSETKKQPSNPRLLLISKQFFNEGNRLALLGDDFSAMKAVLFMDFCVEQMLNVLIDDFSSHESFTREDLKWPELWQGATTALRKAGVMEKIPYHKELKKLHKIRNLVQHQGVTPNMVDVSRFKGPVESMVTKCFEQCYGLNFKDFRL